MKEGFCQKIRKEILANHMKSVEVHRFSYTAVLLSINVSIDPTNYEACQDTQELKEHMKGSKTGLNPLSVSSIRCQVVHVVISYIRYMLDLFIIYAYVKIVSSF